MKTIQSLVTGLFACGLALAMVCPTAAQTTADGTIKVIRMKGVARYSTGNNVWHPLELGAVIKPGTVVQTGKDKDSFVDLVLIDSENVLVGPAVYKPGIPSPTALTSQSPGVAQNVVRVWQNSALGIDKFTTMQTGAGVVNETQLDLKAGRISGTVKKLSPGSRYEIKLISGVAGIRGTLYDLTAEGFLRVLDGTVVESTVGANGEVTTESVGAGWQYDPATGKSPIPLITKGPLDAELNALAFFGFGTVSDLCGDHTIHHPKSPHGPPPPGPPPPR